MAKRKSVSKKIRFEVFKRDNFKCQYCGSAAPDALLELDHIKPVSKGGGNEIINLVTSCQSCNRGKSDIQLDDDTEIKKQRRQLEELNERRNQLEMMLNWRDQNKSIEEDCLSAVIDAVESCLLGRTVNSAGERTLKKWIKKYELSIVLDSIDRSAEQYLRHDENGDLTDSSIEKFFSMVERVAYHKSNNTGAFESNQHAYYARGILRNRLAYIDESKAFDLCLSLINLFGGNEELYELCREIRNWTDFVYQAESILRSSDAKS